LNAKIKKDEQQRISTIQEQDWNVELSYNGNAQQPSKLILKQSLADGQENRITMLIQNR
jgi:outer membrane lipoprotein LolB